MLGAWPPRKRRTREHVIADLSVNYVERQALLCDFSVERVRGDYGYDVLLFTYDSDGYLEEGLVFIQTKATDHPRVSKKRNAVVFRIDLIDLRHWLSELAPVILVVVDAKAYTGYWLHLQEYFKHESGQALLKVKGTKTVYLPLTQRLDPGGVKEIARIKREQKGMVS